MTLWIAWNSPSFLIFWQTAAVHRLDGRDVGIWHYDTERHAGLHVLHNWILCKYALSHACTLLTWFIPTAQRHHTSALTQRPWQWCVHMRLYLPNVPHCNTPTAASGQYIYIYIYRCTLTEKIGFFLLIFFFHITFDVYHTLCCKQMANWKLQH